MIHLTHLADMFPAAGFDQLINCVVGIVRVRGNFCVSEKDSLLSGVLYISDISRRVEDVGEILQIAVGIPRRFQIDQPKRQGIVVVGCLDAVAVLDQSPLSFSVVVDVRDEGRPLGRPSNPRFDPLQQISFVI